MQSHFVEDLEFEVPEITILSESALIESDSLIVEPINLDKPVCFQSQFVDCMEMYADAQTVGKYLDAHQGWFRRCAHPMRVECLGENGYDLTIGKFGSFGYEVEPKIGLELLPREQGVYRIKTIPVPDYIAPGYEVDFKATMGLKEVFANELKLTRVEWQLDLLVFIQFPKFIYKLPKSVIQSTGDRVLRQIVRQVSRRLTHKVQQNFHSSLGIDFPPKSNQKR